MDKYSSYFMKNGRVLFIENEDIQNAIEQNKELLVICNAWSGGYAFVIGADAHPDYDDICKEKDATVYDMYSYDVRDKEFTEEELKKFYKVIVSSGERIYMMTGDEANSYNHGCHIFRDEKTKDYSNFTDWDSKYDKNSFRCREMTEEEFDKARHIVDTERTINSIYDPDEKNKEEKIESLSHHSCGIHWAGTKYETNYNK